MIHYSSIFQPWVFWLHLLHYSFLLWHLLQKFYRAPEQNAVTTVTSMSKGAVREQSAWIQDGVKNQIFKREIFRYQMLLWSSSWISRQTRKHSSKWTRVILKTEALSHTEASALCILADVDRNVQEDKITFHTQNVDAWVRSPAAAFPSPLWEHQDLWPRSSAEGHSLTLQIWHYYESQGTTSLLSKAP